eukprot:181458-Amphidinium_carterae.1
MMRCNHCNESFPGDPESWTTWSPPSAEVRPQCNETPTCKGAGCVLGCLILLASRVCGENFKFGAPALDG